MGKRKRAPSSAGVTPTAGAVHVRPQRASDALPATLGVAILAALTFANTLGHRFVWDDPISLQRWLPALPTWWDAFFPPAGIPQFPSDYYRPLQLLSYRLDRFIGGGEPWAFHLSVVCLHVIATILVFRVGRSLFAGSANALLAAALAAALFAVHPVHSESVAWMAARPDVMVTVAGLAALLAYGRSDWSASRRSLVAASLILIALLCKENAAALLVMVPASAWILGSGRLASPASIAPFIIALVLYLLLRRLGLNSALPAAALSADVLPKLIAAAGVYGRLLLLPFPQNAYISDVPAGALAIGLGIFSVAAVAAMGAWAWRKNDRLILFSLAWITVTLAPSLTLVARGSTAPLAERYLYLPSVGFCWLVGALVRSLDLGRRERRLVTVGGLTTLILCAAVITVQRNRVWYDNFTLWSDTAAKSTVDGLPLRSLAVATLERGDVATAERQFEQALTRRNTARGQFTIYNNLGTIAQNRGDQVLAQRHYRKALEFQPSADTLFNLGLMALQDAMSSERSPQAATRAAKAREARDYFEQALAASPYDPDIHVALGQAAHAMGDIETARRHLQEAITLGLPAATEARVRKLIGELS